MRKLFLLLAVCFMFSGCSDIEKARRILTEQGYTDITMTGYSYWGCAESDTFHDGFSAKSPGGKYCSGVVCSDWFKAATIRLN